MDSPEIREEISDPLTLIDLLYTIIEALVDDPSKVEIEIIESGTLVLLNIKGDADSIRFLLGKKGKTIDAIRLIVGAMGGRLNKVAKVDVIDPARQRQ